MSALSRGLIFHIVESNKNSGQHLLNVHPVSGIELSTVLDVHYFNESSLWESHYIPVPQKQKLKIREVAGPSTHTTSDRMHQFGTWVSGFWPRVSVASAKRIQPQGYLSAKHHFIHVYWSPTWKRDHLLSSQWGQRVHFTLRGHSL